jgi:DNA-nicking Smr family endonuclease
VNKYAQIPNEIIDLHGHTVREAEGVLWGLLEGKKNTHVRIITGKALGRASGPILRTFVKEFLNKNGIKFNQSKIQDGGEGALEVFL